MLIELEERLILFSLLKIQEFISGINCTIKKNRARNAWVVRRKGHATQGLETLSK